MAIEASNLTEKDEYEVKRKKQNEDRLSNSIYRIDYENYLKRKGDCESKLENILSIVEEKRTLLEKEKAEKNRINSHGIYYYRETISGGTKAGIWCSAVFVIPFVLAFFMTPIIGDGIHSSIPDWMLSIPYILSLGIVTLCVILYGMVTGKINKKGCLAKIDESIGKYSIELQEFEKELADAQREYEMIIKSEPKRENY